jgi:hypothetical protein
MRSRANTFALPRSIALTSIPLASIPPTLVTRDEPASAVGPARRT